MLEIVQCDDGKVSTLVLVQPLEQDSVCVLVRQGNPEDEVQNAVEVWFESLIDVVKEGSEVQVRVQMRDDLEVSLVILAVHVT